MPEKEGESCRRVAEYIQIIVQGMERIHRGSLPPGVSMEEARELCDHAHTCPHCQSRISRETGARPKQGRQISPSQSKEPGVYDPGYDNLLKKPEDSSEE